MSMSDLDAVAIHNAHYATVEMYGRMLQAQLQENATLRQRVTELEKQFGAACAPAKITSEDLNEQARKEMAGQAGHGVGEAAPKNGARNGARAAATDAKPAPDAAGGKPS